MKNFGRAGMVVGGASTMKMDDKGNVAILLVEQYLDFAQRLADEFCVMEKGEIVTRGPIKELTEEVVKRHLTV